MKENSPRSDKIKVDDVKRTQKGKNGLVRYRFVVPAVLTTMYLPLLWTLSNAPASHIVPMAVVMIPLYPGFGMANALPEEVPPHIRLAINVWIGIAVIAIGIFIGRRGTIWLGVTCLVLALISYSSYRVFPRGSQTITIGSVAERPSSVPSDHFIHNARTNARFTHTSHWRNPRASSRPVILEVHQEWN